MKKLHVTLLLCFFLFNAYAQHSDAIVIGKKDSITSQLLGEQRDFWVHVPGGNTDGIFEEKKYPVVYLLDGDAHFFSVVGMMHQLSSVNGNTICPQMIVVGILNTNRMRDLTPTKGADDPNFPDADIASNSGGGGAFIAFIEKELMPYIDAQYPTESYKMFIGHSLGGLTVMQTLIDKPYLFNSYVSIDPAMWWDNNKLLQKIKEMPLDNTYQNKTLFLGIANTLSEGMDTVSVQKDTTIMTQHIRSILELNKHLNRSTGNKLSYKGIYYEADTHGSVPLIATYDALRFIFGFYDLKLDMEDFINPENDILAKVENHYKYLSEKFGTAMAPNEAFVNDLGYNLMSQKQFQKAEQMFQLNVRNYPESFNVYDSLGDLYVAIGDKEKAAKNYKTSLALNKDSFSKVKLEALKMN